MANASGKGVVLSRTLRRFYYNIQALIIFHQQPFSDLLGGAIAANANIVIVH